MFGGCTGYQLGNHTLYPAHIRTVYVPIFTSNSFRRNLGEQLTEAVAKEIESKTNYKVVGTSDADSILTGQIVAESKRVVINNLNSDPRELQVHIEIQVNWIDRRDGTVLCEGTIPMPPEMTAISGTANAVPEFGHSIGTAQQQAMQRLAQQIVGLMESPW